jgi:regulator of replication initiation timing
MSITQRAKDMWVEELVKENRNLKEENKNLKEELEQYKKMFEDKLKEVYIKNTADLLDKKFPKINWFMEEDTLQELRDIWEI